MDDETRFELIMEKLYTAVCCDVLDELGYRNQAMRPDIRPIDDDKLLVGWAKTILAVDVYHVGENPYDKEIEAVDSVVPGEVVVGCTNNSSQNSLWGELLSTAAKARGGRGAVIDGLVRDVRQIRQLNFPVFCTGFKPVDSRGRGLVIDFDCPVACGGVLVAPGDLVVGDIDGIVVIPQAVTDNVLRLALDKVTKEKVSKSELQRGALLRDVYAKYGVL
jgi:regulator of RNase E activity RraA